MSDEMYAKWSTFAKSLGAAPEASNNAFWHSLSAGYGSPARKYHSFTHIDACLRVMNRLVPQSLYVTPYLEMALYWHDVIYIPGRQDNEEKSAFEFQKWGRKMGLKERFIADVADMIPYTKHGIQLAGLHERYLYLLDVDLSILGEDHETFDQYERDVRFEYAFVPEEVFRAGRANILQGFLDRPTIYETPIFQREYEARARGNMARSIQNLLGGGRVE